MIQKYLPLRLFVNARHLFKSSTRHWKCVWILLSPNRLDQVLTISRKITSYSEAAGPLETVRIVINSKLHYTVYTFCEIFAEGNLSTPQDTSSFLFLAGSFATTSFRSLSSHAKKVCSITSMRIGRGQRKLYLLPYPRRLA